MRIAVLCNDRLGLPALQQLAQNRLVQAAATADVSPEMVTIMHQLTAQGGVPTQVFSREGFEDALLLWLEKHRPDVVLVKTFPFKIPAAALHIPKYGFINFHYAPLPGFRGPNPLFWMIRNRSPKAGVTIHRMDERFDTGPVLMRQEFPLQPQLTFGMLTSQLAFAGASMTTQLLQGLAADTLQPESQEQEKAGWWGRPKPADLLINWKKMPASETLSLIRACNPWNRGAAVRFRGWMFAISDASESEEHIPAGVIPGTILSIAPGKGLTIACADGKAIRAEAVYTEEGFFEAGRLQMFGLQPGVVFES